MPKFKKNVLENRNVVSPESPLFFKLLTDRVSLTKDLRLTNYVIKISYGLLLYIK